MTEQRLPRWADAWANGTCDCGARLVKVVCAYCAGHVACSASGRGVDADHPCRRKPRDD